MKTKPSYPSQPAGAVTRSISLPREVFERMERSRQELRLDRSTFIRFVLEDHLGIVDRQGLKGPEPDWKGKVKPR